LQVIYAASILTHKYVYGRAYLWQSVEKSRVTSYRRTKSLRTADERFFLRGQGVPPVITTFQPRANFVNRLLRSNQ